MKKIITINGMSCSHCVKHVKEALEGLDGVRNVDVNLNSKTAVIEAALNVKDDDIKTAVDDAGYEVVKIEAL